MKLTKLGIFGKMSGVIRFYLVALKFRGKFKTAGLSLIGSRLKCYILGDGRMQFGRKVILQDNVELQSNGLLILGDGVCVNSYSRIIARDEVRIGNNVTIAQFVSILDHDHDYEFRDGSLHLKGYTTAAIKIGNNVWLGDKCTVLKGVTIGSNVIAGAQTLINKDVPDNCIIGGVPFKILKKISDHVE